MFNHIIEPAPIEANGIITQHEVIIIPTQGKRDTPVHIKATGTGKSSLRIYQNSSE